MRTGRVSALAVAVWLSARLAFRAEGGVARRPGLLGLKESRKPVDAMWDGLDRLRSPDAWGALTTESALELI
jgi:hypothetical protein